LSAAISAVYGRWLAVAVLAACPAAFSASVVRVENPAGSVRVRVAAVENLTVRRTSPQRPLRETDTRITRRPGLILVEAVPEDGARIDLEIELPYRFELEIRARSGAVLVRGFLPRVAIDTEAGDVELAMPWQAMRLDARASARPGELVLPAGGRFREEQPGGRKAAWGLRSRPAGERISYGLVELRAGFLRRLRLEELPFPEESPLKLPWQAAEIVRQLRRPPVRGRAAGVPAEAGGAPPEHEGLARFAADVRLVNLTVSVFDSKGRPLTGLSASDFEVFEDGVPQTVAHAGAEEVPFNLALLLDLSGSTLRDRAAMKEAAKRFLGVARPHDRVAVYALAYDVFQVISPLTTDRARLEALIDAIPEVGGGTPLYDTIALAYAQEFRRRPAERNALIVISDGVDNRLHEPRAPAAVSFPDLVEAVAAMNMLIYPVFLDPFTRVPPPAGAKRARENMSWLARTSGGRLFPARSLAELEPVYALVAEELRSVYSLAYYPKNQKFDGAWRKVQVKVKRPHVEVRTRAGYYAR
jgi:Ca-activated chloride channel family protein